MKRRILIVSKSFYPINSPRSFRTTELVKEFSRKGHEVTLVTPKDDKFHKLFEKEYNVNIIDMKIKNYKVFKLSQGNRLVLFLKRVINRLLQIFIEYPDIELFFKIKKSLQNLKFFDLLISIATPHPTHWGVARALTNNKKIAKIWVADCGDPFMGATLATFNKMFYFKYVEKWWCKKADYISIPFLGAKKAYYKEFHDKIRIIPQGFNFSESEINISKYKPNKVITFAFAGGLIPNSRDPREFIEYILDLKKDFKFIIFTNNKYLIEPYLERAKGKIEIRDYISRKGLLTLLSTMDFVLNINNSISTQLPSKLIDYTLTQRPILSIDSVDINKKIVDEFFERDYSNQFIVKNINQYRIENVCQDFLNLTK